MILWAFLILAFFVGAAACYGLLWYLGGLAARIEQSIEDASKEARITG